MNRDIKFRGKRFDTGEWVMGDMCRMMSDDNLCIMPDSFFATRHFGKDEDNNPIIENSLAIGGFYPVVKDTVGQFTTKIDRNNECIFEDDIIKTPLGHICIIKWDHVREIKSDDAYEYTCFCYHHVIQSKNYHFDEAHRCEVIGNVHEHPHLIKP